MAEIDRDKTVFFREKVEVLFVLLRVQNDVVSVDDGLQCAVMGFMNVLN